MDQNTSPDRVSFKVDEDCRKKWLLYFTNGKNDAVEFYHDSQKMLKTYFDFYTHMIYMMEKMFAFWCFDVNSDLQNQLLLDEPDVLFNEFIYKTLILQRDKITQIMGALKHADLIQTGVVK